jgi:glutaconate CoA-transferase subunit B
MAKALYAPHATLMMESGIIDFEPLLPLNHIADAHSCRGFSYATDLFSAFTMTYRGFVDVCFLGVGQVDKYGNLNTTVIGDYYKPTMRLPGSGGAADFLSYAKRTVLTMLGGNFVNKLDYFTSPGYLDGGDSRDKSGLFPKGTGPTMLLSTKGVFRFDPVTKEIYLAQIHPRVTVEDVKKDVPWDLKVASDLTETPRPTDEEIDFIRRFAPAQSAGRELSMELTIVNLMKKLKA